MSEKRHDDHREAFAATREFLKSDASRAGKGDRAARESVLEFFQDRPLLAAAMGDLSQGAQRAWLDMVNARDPVVAGAMEAYLPELKRQLAGPGASHLERIMVDRVVTDLLQVSVLEWHLATETPTDSPWQKPFEAAHHRLNNSIRSLAMARRLLAASVSAAAFQTRQSLPGDASGHGEAVPDSEVERNFSIPRKPQSDASKQAPPEPRIVRNVRVIPRKQAPHPPDQGAAQ